MIRINQRSLQRKRFAPGFALLPARCGKAGTAFLLHSNNLTRAPKTSTLCFSGNQTPSGGHGLLPDRTGEVANPTNVPMHAKPSLRVRSCVSGNLGGKRATLRMVATPV